MDDRPSILAADRNEDVNGELDEALDETFPASDAPSTTVPHLDHDDDEWDEDEDDDWDEDDEDDDDEEDEEDDDEDDWDDDDEDDWDDEDDEDEDEDEDDEDRYIL